MENFNRPEECEECPICGLIPNSAEMDCGYPQGLCPNK